MSIESDKRLSNQLDPLNVRGVLAGSETAVRILLINKADQVLLQKVSVPGRPDFYITPGGRLDDSDESLLGAVRRELKEETGFDAVKLRSDVPEFTGRHIMEKKKGLVEMTEHFFVGRLEEELDTILSDRQNLTDEEKEAFLGQRWFNVSELSDPAFIIVPVNLASLVSEVLAGRQLPIVDFSDPPAFS